MSHWQAGSVKLQCNLEVMIKVLMRVKPSWVKHIQTSPAGNLKIVNDHTGEVEDGYSIVIRHGGYRRDGKSGADDIKFADIGMKYDPNSKEWKYKADTPYLPDNLKKFDKVLTQEAGVEQAHAIANQLGLQVKEIRVGGQTKVVIRAPVSKTHMLGV